MSGMPPIVLVHHADAVGPEVDPMRPLSSVGRATADRLGALVAARGVVPVAIWHSGKLRARQTAESLWKACNPFASVTAVRGLQPDDPARWMHDQLTGETRSLIIVGHMPYLPRLLASLRDGASDGSPASFPAHGCVALECRDDRWCELWRIEP